MPNLEYLGHFAELCPRLRQHTNSNRSEERRVRLEFRPVLFRSAHFDSRSPYQPLLNIYAQPGISRALRRALPSTASAHEQQQIGRASCKTGVQTCALPICSLRFSISLPTLIKHLCPTWNISGTSPSSALDCVSTRTATDRKSVV